MQIATAIASGNKTKEQKDTACHSDYQFFYVIASELVVAISSLFKTEENAHNKC